MNKLSDFFDNWEELTNDKGRKPAMDFACTSVFRMDNDFHRNAYRFYDMYKDRAQMGKRSLTIRNIDEIRKYFVEESGVADVISRKVGVNFVLHPMKSETFLYNLTPDVKVQKNIDNWHYDYMPFVFVYMVEKDDNGSGKLILDLGKEKKEINLSVGEGIFMQGSMIRHLAQRCESGRRTTLVLSFLAKDVTVVDNTHVTKDMCPYHKGENLHEQYLEYKRERVDRLSKMKNNLMETIQRERSDIFKSWL